MFTGGVIPLAQLQIDLPVAPGKIIAEAPRDKDAVVVADLNFDLIDEVRSVWQFYRDRRPDAYGPLVQP